MTRNAATCEHAARLPQIDDAQLQPVRHPPVLPEAVHQIAARAAMYGPGAAPGADGETPAEGEEAKPEEGTVEGEFREV